jgi:L,D-transpeptidase ErfK/SrfK
MQINYKDIFEYFNRIFNPQILRVLLLIVIFIFISLFSVYISLIQVPRWQENRISRFGHSYNCNNNPIKEKIIKNEKEALVKKIKKYDSRIADFVPKSNYILINTTSNVFFLYKNKKLFRTGRCSTGSYTLLTSEKKKKQWIFKTPKGKFYIHGKTTDPIWIKPDWAFVEEGLPVPPANHPSRYETGVLGDYALSLGQGYLIHGTLYKRFLGMPVTHGCIRLNDEDLDVVYHTLEVGSRVYIF